MCRHQGFLWAPARPPIPMLHVARDHRLVPYGPGGQYGEWSRKPAPGAGELRRALPADPEELRELGDADKIRLVGLFLLAGDLGHRLRRGRIHLGRPDANVAKGLHQNDDGFVHCRLHRVGINGQLDAECAVPEARGRVRRRQRRVADVPEVEVRFD